MVKKNNECKVTVDVATRYDFPYFVPIEDGDEVTVKHYKEHDVPVANIALPGRKKRYCTSTSKRSIAIILSEI